MWENYSFLRKCIVKTLKACRLVFEISFFNLLVMKDWSGGDGGSFLGTSASWHGNNNNGT